MRGKLFLSLLAALALAPTGAWAYPTTPGYDYAQIFAANSTVTMMSRSTGPSGVLRGVKCVFPEGGAVRVTVTTEGTLTESFILDSTNYARESSAAGQYLSGWQPLFRQWFDSVTVQLNNTGLGTNTINCWLGWSTVNIE